MSYKLKLEVFEGPLDLLLYLIKKNDIDIKDIPIASITEQYLQYIDMMKMLDLDIVGDFLVMAATLLQIKSKMLLPPDPSEVVQEELDPRDELVRRLQEHQKFKEIAEELRLKEAVRRDLFSRQLDEEKTQELIDESKEVYFEATLFDLITALTSALNKAPSEIIHEIFKEEFTVEKKLHEILHLLLEKSSVHLNELFGKARTKVEIIVTFMAVLELIRLKEIVAVQKRHFDEIWVMRNKDNVAPRIPGSNEAENAAEENDVPAEPQVSSIDENQPSSLDDGSTEQSPEALKGSSSDDFEPSTPGLEDAASSEDVPSPGSAEPPFEETKPETPQP
ncbi:MAG: hypothetical protein A2Z88_02140 [Omnitrophica WOR_2 bacterium GWA2_47_8]|nr:MAG: hypothetical protein A2Z88_02140 [Omnitrophica WOR_2 bacterium GWA2_47_8]